MSVTKAASAQPLRSLVFTTYRKAVKAGSLHFTETEVHNITHEGINVCLPLSTELQVSIVNG